MRFLIDTNILIDHLRGFQSSSLDILKNINDKKHEGFLSVISLMELYSPEKLSEKQEEALEKMLGIFDEVVAVEQKVAKTAGRLLGKYSKSHGLEPSDALIAATAIELDAVLVTRNVRHFKFISNLIVYEK